MHVRGEKRNDPTCSHFTLLVSHLVEHLASLLQSKQLLERVGLRHRPRLVLLAQLYCLLVLPGFQLP